MKASEMEETEFGECETCHQAYTEPPVYASGQRPFGGDIVCSCPGDNVFYVVSGVKRGNIYLYGAGNTDSYAPGQWHLKQRAPGVKEAKWATSPKEEKEKLK